MLFRRQKVIFLHLPKTGGNSVQQALEASSEDRITISKHQDGVDRFGVSGPVTPGKHATLAAYARIMGEEVEGFRIAIGCREPFERAVSRYFSPNRWLKEEEAGVWRQQTPIWSLDRFNASVEMSAAAADSLTVQSELRRPHWLLRHEHLDEDFQRFVEDAALSHTPLKRLNRTFAAPQAVKKALADPEARALAQTALRAEYELFGYPLQ